MRASQCHSSLKFGDGYLVYAGRLLPLLDLLVQGLLQQRKCLIASCGPGCSPGRPSQQRSCAAPYVLFASRDAWGPCQGHSRTGRSPGLVHNSGIHARPSSGNRERELFHFSADPTFTPPARKCAGAEQQLDSSVPDPPLHRPVVEVASNGRLDVVSFCRSRLEVVDSTREC